MASRLLTLQVSEQVPFTLRRSVVVSGIMFSPLKELIMDTSTLTKFQRIERRNIRNFLLTATVAELHRAKELYGGVVCGVFKQASIQEMIDECTAAGVAAYGDLPLT